LVLVVLEGLLILLPQRQAPTLFLAPLPQLVVDSVVIILAPHDSMLLLVAVVGVLKVLPLSRVLLEHRVRGLLVETETAA
jgi:hypothetical protein